MSDARLRSLYLCYLSLEDPLVETQVVAYLEGLAARGHTIHLLTWEPRMTRAARRERRAALAARGIAWHALRYHKRPSLPATIYDALVGAAFAVGLVRRHRLQAIHARSHVPAAGAMIACRLSGAALLFDIRGLWAEEYVDAGRWQRGGIPWRITKRVERAALRRASGIVVLTERVRDLLFPGGDPRVTVIPCCVDLTAYDDQAADRADRRSRLGLGDEPLLVYVGKLTGWYLQDEMVELFARARAELPALRLLVLTQSDRAPLEEALARHDIPAGAVTVDSVSPAEIPGWLAAADAAMALIRPSPSKISSSPTKIGEYLAAGLPVVTVAGVGDVDAVLTRAGAGIVLDGWDGDDLRDGARALVALLRDGADHDRMRAVARAELDLHAIGIPRYDAVYGLVLTTLRGAGTAPG